MHRRTLGAAAASIALVAVPVSPALAKNAPCGRAKPAHANCGKQKGKGHVKGGAGQRRTYY